MKLQRSKFRKLLVEEHRGDAAFEFIIVMVLFAGIIFGVMSTPLLDVIKSKINIITDYITNNNNPANHV